MRRGSEYRALMGAVGAIVTVGGVSSVAGIADHVAAAGLVAAGLVWLAVAVLRRERRIRARLADPRILPAPRRAVEVSELRVGPGDSPPVPPAPTRRPAHHRAPEPGRADSTGGAR